MLQMLPLLLPGVSFLRAQAGRGTECVDPIGFSFRKEKPAGVGGWTALRYSLILPDDLLKRYPAVSWVLDAPGSICGNNIGG